METARSKDHPISLAFGLVLPLCLLGTALATWAMYRTTTALDQARFASDAQWTVDALRRRIAGYTALLQGAAGLFAANERVDRGRFEAYVQQLELGEHYQGIQGIGFARRVTASEKAEVETRLRAELGPDFRIHPEGDRPEFFPITYLQPQDERNLQAIGYDMYSEPVRKEAMSRACDTGEFAASAKVVLVQEIYQDKQPGLLIYYPVYRGGLIPATVQERRDTLFGFVYSPFRAHDMLRGAFSEQQRKLLSFAIYDGRELRPENLLFLSSSPPERNPRFTRTTGLQVAGRAWTIRFQTTKEFVAQSHRSLVWSVFGSGLALTGVVVGITHSLSRARGKAVRLQGASSRLAAIVESSNDAILSQDLDRLVTTWNRGAERLFGYSAAEMVGTTLDSLAPADHEGEDEKLLGEIRQGKAVTNFETVRTTKDGRRLDVLVTISPLWDAEGRVVGASKIFQDITDRKRAERELRQAQAALEAHAENLETIVAERTAKLKETIRELEAFSYSLSHDMRTPLRSIRSYSQFLMADFGPKLEPAALEYLQKIVAAVRRMERLISDVLELTRMSRKDMRIEPVDLGPLIERLIRERDDLQPPRASVIIQGPLPVVLGNHASLEQCVGNLLSNAVKFVAPGVKPVVRVYADAANDNVRIFIEDNGIGIPEEAHARIFELFHRHAAGRTYEGTGLGLAIVRRAAERMSGHVGVDSEVGKGSRFWLELPLAERSGGTNDVVRRPDVS